MPEAGHENIEEDRRGSVSIGLFRVHLRRLQLESSRGLFAISVRTCRQNKLSVGGRESTKSPQPRCAKMRTAFQQCKKRSCYLPIVRLVRAIVSYIWLRDSVKTFVAVDYFIRAPSQSARQSLLSTSRSRPMRVFRGFSLCRDPSANAGAEDLVAPESAQAFHFFLSERFHRSVTVDRGFSQTNANGET